MNPLLTTVATEVAGEFGSRLSAILAPSRGVAQDARSRAISIHVYQRLAPGSLTEMGAIFGRDRTTVRHALNRVEGWRRDERGFQKRLEQVLTRVTLRQ